MNTPLSRLVDAMVLAITAPAGREHDADDLVQYFAAGLSPDEIETAKKAALRQIKLAR